MRRITAIPPLGILSMLLLNSGPGRCANCTCHRRNERVRDNDIDNDARSASFLLFGEPSGMLVIMSVSIDGIDEQADGNTDRGRHDFLSMFGLDPAARHMGDMHGSGSFHLGGALFDMGDVNDDNGDGRLMMHDGSIDRGRLDINPMFAIESTGPTQQEPDHRGRPDIVSMFALDLAGQHHRHHDHGRLDDGYRHPADAWTMTGHPRDIGIDDDDGVDPALVQFNASIAHRAGAGQFVTA
jgi:hypothetical protein